jgi:hypothetical protein
LFSASLAIAICGCTPAFVGYHASDPFTSGSEGDTSIDMLGAGACLEKNGAEICAFAGPRRVVSPYLDETSVGVQVIAIYRVRRERVDP